MLLSQLLQKTLYTGETPRGVTVSIGFSLKTHAIKHLLCALQEPPTAQPQNPDFAVNVSSISAVADGISLTRIRPVLPKAQTKLFLYLPVYSHDGVFLGKLTDGEIHNFVLTRLFTDRGNAFSPSSIAVCRDAIFLRKEQPYPLGQRVPSPLLSQLQSDETSVTKPLLRRAVQQGTLVKLTLSLPPFALLSDG
ncbi:MAG: hypothetical protein IJY21_03125 [Clostridia bacterium]|nr:hypothetical protein [Clostridia bacterium]